MFDIFVYFYGKILKEFEKKYWNDDSCLLYFKDCVILFIWWCRYWRMIVCRIGFCIKYLYFWIKNGILFLLMIGESNIRGSGVERFYEIISYRNVIYRKCRI